MNQFMPLNYMSFVQNDKTNFPKFQKHSFLAWLNNQSTSMTEGDKASQKARIEGVEAFVAVVFEDDQVITPISS